MDILNNIEATPLGFDDLERMLGPAAEYTNLMEYNELRDVRTAEDLFSGDTKAVLILLEIETPGAPKVGHWITLLDLGDHYEHFDSYGIDMDEELAITHEHPYLSDLFRHPRKKLVQTPQRLQARREHVNTCGRYCVVRARLMGRLQQFIQLIQVAHTQPDNAIALMTMFL